MFKIEGNVVNDLCKNLALYIRDCESLCLSDETLKAVGPFYLVSMPGEVKDPTQGKMCNLSWTPHSNLEKDNSLKTTPVLAQRWAVWSILTKNSTVVVSRILITTFTTKNNSGMEAPGSVESIIMVTIYETRFKNWPSWLPKAERFLTFT